MRLDLGAGVSMRLVLVPAGKFMMGSRRGEDPRRKDEARHEVTVGAPFYMGATHVTVDQFSAFVRGSGYRTDAEREGWSWGVEMRDGRISGDMGRGVLASKRIDGAHWRKPGFEQGGDHPVVHVSWNDAVAFCEWLSKRGGRDVGLPTEAQWEYACRAGTETAYPWGDDPGGGKGWANCADESLRKLLADGSGIVCFDWDDGFVFTSPVGRLKANGFGLFDMIGNAAHWCQDRYGAYGAAATDPSGPAAGPDRVLRGGSWNNYDPRNCRSASRYRFAPGYRNERYGFRVVSPAGPPPGAPGGDSRPTADARRPEVPADAEQCGGSWFRVYHEELSWEDAKKKCRKLGGRLAVVPDRATWDFLLPRVGKSNLWLGATDADEEGEWKWVDGSRVEFAAWGPGQPNKGRTGQDYAYTVNGGWNDIAEDGTFGGQIYVHGFVCEWPAKK